MRLGPLERHAATGLALWERAIGRPDARARRLDVTPQGQDMCWRAVGGGADYHANTVRPHRERRKTLTGDRGSNDRFGANQLVSANVRKWAESGESGSQATHSSPCVRTYTLRSRGPRKNHKIRPSSGRSTTTSIQINFF